MCERFARFFLFKNMSNQKLYNQDQSQFINFDMIHITIHYLHFYGAFKFFFIIIIYVNIATLHKYTIFMLIFNLIFNFIS